MYDLRFLFYSNITETFFPLAAELREKRRNIDMIVRLFEYKHEFKI